MSSAALEKWVVRRRPNPDASLRLFCAAWAGGNATAFQKWPSSLPDTVELCALQLPGRMGRSKEACLESVPAVVEGAAEALIAMGLLDKPFVLFGHSFGSLVMFELARKLGRDASVTPLYLVVSGCRPPNLGHVFDYPHDISGSGMIPIGQLSWAPVLQLLARLCGAERSPSVSQLPRDAFVDHLVALGGMPAELRDQAELLDYFLPPIRADYTAFEGYRYDEHGPRTSPLTCTVVCLGGDEDSGAPRSDLEHWASFTTGEFRLRMFPGGHFFLKDGGSAVVLEYLRQFLAL